MKLTQFLVLLGALLAGWAAFTNMRAARRGVHRGRVLCAMRGVLALVYSGAYFWLYFNPAERLHWSYVMQGVSLPVWLIVWRQPAVVSLQIAGKGRKKKNVDNG